MISTTVTSATIDAVRINGYMTLVAIVILYYDYLVTLPIEIQYIWPKPSSKSSIWFFVNRYIPIFGNIPILLSSFASATAREQSCRSYELYHQLLLVLNQTVVVLLMASRTYALYGGSRRIVMVLAVLFVVLIPLTAWSLVGQDSDFVPGVSGCSIAISSSTAYHVAIPWEAQFVYDVVIFSLTLFKSYSHRKQLRWHESLSRSTSMGFVQLIFYDGAIYFAVMALVNFVNIVLFFFTSALLKGVLSTFASCIAVTTMSRILLNLHEAASKTPRELENTQMETAIDLTTVIRD